MICCKIITNYNLESASFGGLIKDLTKIGDVLWENNSLYFGCTDDYFVDSKKLGRVLRKNGYKDFYINSYDKTNEPQDGDYINGWITERLIRMNYKQYEDASQSVFKNISEGLDILDAEIEKLYQKQSQSQTQTENKEVES